MPTVEPSKEQLQKQRTAPPQKDPHAIESHGHQDSNANMLTDSAKIEREQKSHLGSSNNDPHRKARAPPNVVANECILATATAHSAIRLDGQDPSGPCAKPSMGGSQPEASPAQAALGTDRFRANQDPLNPKRQHILNPKVPESQLAAEAQAENLREVRREKMEKASGEAPTK